MGRLKQLASDTVLYGISTVVSRFLNYLLVPFYTASFLPEDYGIIGLAYGAMIFLNVIFTFGMESAYFRYGAERDNRKTTWRQIQSLIILVSIGLSVLVYGGKPWLESLLSIQGNSHYLFEMMVGIIVLDAISAVPFADLRLERKALTFMVLRIANVFINIGLNLVLILKLKWGIEAVLVSNLVASLFSAVFSLVLTFKGLTLRFDTVFIKKILLFGLPYIPAGIGYAINEVLDRFLINQLDSATILAIYGEPMSAETLTGIYNACYKLGIFMMLFIQMFRMAWQPFYMNHHKEEQAKRTFAQSFIVINAIAGFLVLCIGLFRNEIAALPIPFMHTTLIDSRYWLGLSIVPFLLLAYWFQLWYTHFTAGIVLAEKTGILSKATLVGALITVLANLMLIPQYGLIGAALATLLSYMSMSFYMLYQSMKLYPLPYLWKTSLLSILMVFVLLLNGMWPFIVINSVVVMSVGILGLGLILWFQWKMLQYVSY